MVQATHSSSSSSGSSVRQVVRHVLSRDGLRGSLVRRLGVHGRFVFDAANERPVMVECQAVGCAFIVTMCRADGVLEEWVCAFFARSPIRYAE